MSNLKPVAINAHYIRVGYQGRSTAVARVVIVNDEQKLLHDIYIRPDEGLFEIPSFEDEYIFKKVKNGLNPLQAAEIIAQHLKPHIVVGQDLVNLLDDLKVTSIYENRIRDLRKYSKVQLLYPGGAMLDSNVSIQRMAHEILGATYPTGCDKVVEDAINMMRLYKLAAPTWEAEIKSQSSILSTWRPATTHQAQQESEGFSWGALAAGAAAAGFTILTAKYASNQRRNRE
ncbi:unnamed protein product [Bursaphelenchus okinawaensis]|uniref:Exonuclease domain-containing protein n=1 Tax=Bursaphelenchus okinawaensis TaxID=465554 RepID=A0A811KT23_9BILA|nr:unnamed protein product [Bursaphelenchus okinawaensis]CAG9109486.1 unnamed protein product [Bursaphelenchus okinawaensis]